VAPSDDNINNQDFYLQKFSKGFQIYGKYWLPTRSSSDKTYVQWLQMHCQC